MLRLHFSLVLVLLTSTLAKSTEVYPVTDYKLEESPSPKYSLSPAPVADAGNQQLPYPSPSPAPIPGNEELPSFQYPSSSSPSPAPIPGNEELPSFNYPAPKPAYGELPPVDQYPSPTPAPTPVAGYGDLPSTDFPYYATPPPFIEDNNYAAQTAAPMSSSDLDGNDQYQSTDQAPPVAVVQGPNAYSSEDEVDAFVLEQEAYSANKKSAGAAFGVMLGVCLVGLAGFVYVKTKKDKKRLQYYNSLSKKDEV